MDKPLYQCWVKATNAEEGPPRRSGNWVVARRARFRVFADRIECGDWTIPFESVVNGTVYRTSQMFMPVRVLQLETGNETFQFGFNPWANPLPHIPIDLPEERVALGMSPFSVIVRLTGIGFLVYWAWKGSR